LDNNIEISLKNSYLSEIDTKKNNQNKKEKNFNIVAESNLSRSKDNIYLLASYQNLNIIKIFQIDNNENSLITIKLLVKKTFIVKQS